ncbi:unnamed protein product [Symbiodinium sp. KB8]|nr:unnamed protein product [Symbiodinium sp. KB8]
MAVFDLSRPASCLGEHITSDHVYRDSDAMNEEARLVLVIKDVATAFMYAYPSALKDAEECQTALPHFIASTDQVGVFYIDDAKDLTKVSKTLGWRHEHSKDYVHQSNAIAERAVRATSEGTCFKLAFLMCMGLRSAMSESALATLQMLLTAQAAEIEDASRKVEQPMVIDPAPGKSIPLPEGDRYYDSGLTTWRYTNILPRGGEAIMDDEDDWRNQRRRNKKLRFKWPAPMSREEITDLMVLVARPVGKKELTQNAKAQAAVDMNKKALEMESAIERYKRVAGPEFRKLKKVATPFYDGKIACPIKAEAEIKGKLAGIARSAMDYRRFVEAEAEMHKQLAGIRDPGSVDIEAIAPRSDQDATPEEIALANELGIFALDLGYNRASKEAASSSTVFKGVEELTEEENVVYSFPRGSVGSQKPDGRKLTSKSGPSSPPAKSSSSVDTDVVMRTHGSAGQILCTMTIPADSAEASPPGRDGAYWLRGTDLPVSDVLEAFKLPSDNKPRYQVLIRKTSDIEFEIQRVHCVQGHMGALLSDQADVKDTREAVHTFVEWDASLMTRPKISPYDRYSVAFEKFPLKLGYRGTCVRNCSDVARYRFIPRGLALHGRGTTPLTLVMMSKDLSGSDRIDKALDKWDKQDIQDYVFIGNDEQMEKELKFWCGAAGMKVLSDGPGPDGQRSVLVGYLSQKEPGAFAIELKIDPSVLTRKRPSLLNYSVMQPTVNALCFTQVSQPDTVFDMYARVEASPGTSMVGDARYLDCEALLATSSPHPSRLKNGAGDTHETG